jgi:translation initiation factor 2 beta subunit (eIF-2beta)/eIF-5
MANKHKNVNINDSTDPFYRYKRPVASLKHSVNFTEFVNLDEVAAKLARTPDLLLFYIQQKLATQTNIKKKTLRGRFSVQQIEELIKQFTQMFVLCGTCNNPETELTKKGHHGRLICASCGGKTHVDLDDKLLRHI